MNSKNEDKPVFFVEEAEEEQLSRNVLIWLNTFPDIPETVDTIRYEALKDDTTCMALSTIQGAYITKRYILGGYRAEYQFKVIYRIKPGNSMDKRLKADELLDKLGIWASRNKPNWGDIRVLWVGPTTQSSLFAMYENRDEDHQILMKLEYEVI